MKRGEEYPEDSHLLAEELTTKYAVDEDDKVNVSVVSSGSAAKHTLMGMLNFSFYDPRRKTVRFKQAARGGIGTILREKRIKALVVKYKGIKGNLNNVADLGTINKVGVKYHKQMHDLDYKQNEMRKIGTANTVMIMNQYDLLPTRNFQTGGDPETVKIAPEVFINHYLTQAFTTATGLWLHDVPAPKLPTTFAQNWSYAGQVSLLTGQNMNVSPGWAPI